MKRIIICGAGEVGRHAAEVLATEGHSVTVVDIIASRLHAIEETVDVRSIKGSACHASTLKEAGVGSCDLLVAATNHDEFNLLTAAVGKRMGAGRVVARIHNRSYIDSVGMDYRDEFGIDSLICPEQLTSLAITGNLDDPGVVEIQRFASNQIEMHRYEVSKGSAAIGTRLSDLRLPAGVRMAVVQRDGKCFTPGADTIVELDDVVTLIGAHKHFKQVQGMFNHKRRKNQKIVLMGGTSMGEWLAEDLHKRDFSIRLFEADRARAIELSERLTYLTVIHGDPTNPTEFKEEHLDQCAAFIAISDNDEHNILGSLQAKQLGAPITAAVIHSPTFLPLLENLGIDWPFSPRIVAAKNLLKLVDDSPVKRLTTLAPKVADVYEVGPVSKGTAVNKILKEIHLPAGTFIAALQRGDEVHVPIANDEVHMGDLIVAIGPAGIESALKDLFIGK